jgi:hypothetical protein
MIRSLVSRGAYGPTTSAYIRLLRIGFASLVLFGLLWLAGESRAALETQFGGKEGAILVVILVAGSFYFAFAFLVRAVTFSEVRSAFRREPGAPNGGAALPPGLDG